VSDVEDENRQGSHPDPTKVFVVHGRNEKARIAMFAFLRAIGLQPIEWSEAVSLTGTGPAQRGRHSTVVQLLDSVRVAGIV
jgi:predicted nucleotide-binding protein